MASDASPSDSSTPGNNKRKRDDKYILPANEAEFSRLDTQHRVVKMLLGNLYPFPEVVEPLLLSSEGGPKRILDVGCGSGAWSLEMAKIYPHVSILGLDVSLPNHDSSKVPANVTFKTQDVNKDMSEYYGQFDLIHMRFLGPFLKIDGPYIQLERCLKPGGAFITLDATPDVETENWGNVKMKKIEGDEDKSGLSDGGSWFRRMYWELGDAMTLSGIENDRTTAYKYQGFWDHSLLDPDTATHAWFYMPLGPWKKTDNAEETQILQTAGELMRQSMSNLHRTWHTMFLRFGLSQETLDDWSKGVQEELDAMERHHSMRILINCARRRAGDGLPAPPLPTVSTEQDAQKVTKDTDFPRYQTFHSAKEVATARIERDGAPIGELGTSAVMRASKAKAEREKAVDAET